jgi:hypothetical protein
MAITTGIGPLLEAARLWRDRCLAGEGSLFGDDPIWSGEHLDELNRYFVENLDYGSGTFTEKLQSQLGPTTSAAKKLAAEMMYVLLLFPNNITGDHKRNLVKAIWEWSGDPFPQNHPLLDAPLAQGVGSGGMGFNNFRWAELVFFILLMRDWRLKSREEQERLLSDPWNFGAWLDTIPGAQKRQFRHMLLHLLFPETYERISSGSHKLKVEKAFLARLRGEGHNFDGGTTLLARDRRLLEMRRVLEAQYPGQPLDFYRPPLHEVWKEEDEPAVMDPPLPPHVPVVADRKPRLVVPPATQTYAEPPFPEIVAGVRDQGLRISEQTLRRYHLALRARGFVILSGVSGTGKTWLAEAYARAVSARYLIVPVAPNWTTNEDLLGYVNPLDGEYHDTAFSRFLREAGIEYEQARAGGRLSRPYHLILDEMNLARVEYYFARFLSVMEVRARSDAATIELGPEERVLLPPTLRFIGTVNVDETTHGFADKVYDRAQLIELEASRESIAEHLSGKPHRAVLLEIWDAVHGVAPFAYRVADEIGHYLGSAEGIGAELDELLDEQILQKILPKLKGTDPRVGDALAKLEEITHEQFPLSHKKVLRMREGFQQHGFASFF